jgi:localization factor PodJL
MLGALAILPGHAAAQSGGNPAQERLPALVRLTAGGVPALERDAEQGKPEAMAMLGEAYGFGFGNLPVDGGKAAGWLGRAGQAGVPGAAREAAFFAFRERNAAFIAAGALALENGRRIVAGQAPVDADGNGQPEWDHPDPVLERLGSLGLTDAELVLGDMHALGRGAPQDAAVAARWYLLAADSGSADAHHALAVMLASGELGEPRMAEAARHEAAAADLGLPVAQYGMAQDLDSGGQDGSTAAEAMKWYLLAASGGVREAAAAADRLEAASGPAIAGEARARAAEWRRSHPARQRQP